MEHFNGKVSAIVLQKNTMESVITSFTANLTEEQGTQMELERFCGDLLPSFLFSLSSQKSNDISILLILLTTLLSVISLGMSSMKNTDFHLKGPSALPILGHLYLLVRRPHHTHVTLTGLAKIYGEFFNFQLGSKKTVVLSSFEIIREVFYRITDRPAWFLVRKTTENCKGLVWQSGEDWKALRKFSHRGLKSLYVGAKSLEERVQEEVTYMLDQLATSSAEPLNTSLLLQQATSNITCSLCFGDRFDYEDVKFCRLLEMIRKIFTEFSISEPINFFSLLEYLPYSSRVRNSFRYMKAIDELIMEEISRHRATFDPEAPRDFIDLYLQEELAGFEEDQAFTDVNIRLIIRDLFIAGSETTATTLQWLLLYMASHPQVQQRCYAEITELLGCTETSPPYSIKQHLPYTEATILEVQRLSSVVPFLLHQNNRSAKTFRGETIPCGTAILANVYAIHTSEELWEKASHFQPERFLDNEGNVCRNKKGFMPFGIGPRQCPGSFLAKMELFLFFVGLVRRFEIRLEDESRPPTLVGKTGVTLAPVEHKLRFVPRAKA